MSIGRSYWLDRGGLRKYGWGECAYLSLQTRISALLLAEYGWTLQAATVVESPELSMIKLPSIAIVVRQATPDTCLTSSLLSALQPSLD